MASIKLKHSGGNGTIIAAPTSNPASDKTLTLPSDVDGTVVSKDSSNSLQNIAGVNGGQLGNRNLVINGAMNVAVRGTSSTSNAYATIDRWRGDDSGTDEATTKAQVDVAAGTTPYTLGFRKAFQLTNGNQTSGAGATDHATITHYFEAQNIANSGWNYLSSSSYVTLSFWVKSSVAQNFYGYVRTHDGSSYLYPFETGSLSADTWTKITKTIPGNSNLQIDNDNGVGFGLFISAFRGTGTTGSVTLNQWGAYNSSVRAPDYTSTWWTTNDATIAFTGFQFEVGSTATAFEHRSYAQELALCQRYYYAHNQGSSEGVGNFTVYQANDIFGYIPFPVEMRAIPSLVTSNATNHFVNFAEASADNFDSFASIWDKSERGVFVNANASQNVSRAASAKSCMVTTGNAASKLAFNAEL